VNGFLEVAHLANPGAILVDGAELVFAQVLAPRGAGHHQVRQGPSDILAAGTATGALPLAVLVQELLSTRRILSYLPEVL